MNCLCAQRRGNPEGNWRSALHFAQGAAGHVPARAAECKHLARHACGVTCGAYAARAHTRRLRACRGTAPGLSRLIRFKGWRRGQA